MPSGAFHLFVYGTLRQGRGGPAALLSRCERVGDGRVRGTLYDMGSYPALLLGGEDEVKGEIWRCPYDLLDTLDAYEGVEDGLFRRAAVEVGDRPCWVYVAGPRLGGGLKPDRRINAGEWEP